MDFRKAAELDPAFVKRQQKARRPMADPDEGNTKISPFHRSPKSFERYTTTTKANEGGREKDLELSFMNIHRRWIFHSPPLNFPKQCQAKGFFSYSLSLFSSLASLLWLWEKARMHLLEASLTKSSCGFQSIVYLSNRQSNRGRYGKRRS